MIRKIIILSFLFTCFPFVTKSLAQQNLDLNCGRFQLDVDDDGDFQYLYPADFDETKHVRTDGGLSFMSSNWTDQNGAFFPDAWEVDTYPYSSRKILKYAPTTIFVDGDDVTIPMSTAESVDPGLISDQIVEQIYISSMGLRIVSLTYGFSHYDYQDFAITHFQIINTGEADEFAGVDLDGQDLTDVHLILDRWRIWPGDHIPDVHHPGVFSYYMDYYGDEPQDSLKIFYGWDGDDPTNGPYEDEGNPAYGSNWEFLTPYYAGIGLIHADQSVADRSNDPTRAASVLRGGTYELGNLTGNEIYSYLTVPGNFPQPIDPDIPGANPRNEQQPRIYMSVGPYNLAFGDTINIVLFFGVGNRSIQECKEWGTRYKNDEITDEQKNQFLRWGKTDLYTKCSRAIELWNNGLQIPTGRNPLPPAELTVESGPGIVDLSWDVVPEASDYNIYRAVGVADSVLYDLIAEGVSESNYTDEEVNRGFDYYYYITAVDNGLESSHYWTRTFRKSAVPRTAQGSEDMKDVRVVPNPFVYDKSGQLNYTGKKDKLLFAGLPGPCKISIFTVTGDLVDEINHDSHEGIHEWFQITKYNQYIVSGVYIYHVESKEGKGSMIGKFIIIR